MENSWIHTFPRGISAICSGFELVSPSPIPTTISITPQVFAFLTRLILIVSSEILYIRRMLQKWCLLFIRLWCRLNGLHHCGDPFCHSHNYSVVIWLMISLSSIFHPPNFQGWADRVHFHFLIWQQDVTFTTAKKMHHPPLNSAYIIYLFSVKVQKRRRMWVGVFLPREWIQWHTYASYTLRTAVQIFVTKQKIGLLTGKLNLYYYTANINFSRITFRTTLILSRFSCFYY